MRRVFAMKLPPSVIGTGLVLIASLAMMLGTTRSSAQRAPRCTAGFLFCGNCMRPISVTTKRNTTCVFNYFTGGAIFSQKVTKRGSGVYGTTNPTSAAYQPKPGYIGKDYFEVQIQYERGGSKFTTTLQADVTVTD